MMRRLGLTRTAHAVSLQPLVEVASSTELVGRTTELAQLADTWARVETGRRELVLVAGEPGMGKTSLALAFAQMRAAGGATVLVGRHDREALVPYQPFVEALGWFARVCPQEDLHRHVVAMGGGAELGTADTGFAAARATPGSHPGDEP